MSSYGWPEESNDEVIAGLIKVRNTLEAECHREHDKNVGLTDRIRTLEAELAHAKTVINELVTTPFNVRIRSLEAAARAVVDEYRASGNMFDDPIDALENLLPQSETKGDAGG